jgi:hypothetical protein
MHVHFRKDSAGEFTLHCVRDDGTETWRKYHFGNFQIEHDLMHFVVETTLRYKDAFYGMIASGKDLSWFETPTEGSKKKPQISSVEAMNAEILVGQLQTLRDDEEFFALAPSVFESFNMEMPAVTWEQVRQMRDEVGDLVTQWNNSKDGITLEF